MNERKDYLKWDEYFIGLAILCALRSKDPNTRVGACIVNDENKVISLGYNGMPIGCADSDMPWGKDKDEYLDNKYPFVCHAELNAVVNCYGKNIKNSTLYTTLFPCNECAKVIIQSGIKKVIYMDDKYKGTKSNIAAKHMFDLASVEYIKYNKKEKKIEIIV